MKAMIFSAGLGTRFRPWTEKHPKALALVNGKPLLQRNIEYLQQYGVTDIIINVHHFAGQVIDAIEKNKGWGSSIRISDETQELLDTGGGVLHARSLFPPGEDFMTINVDILMDLDLEKFVAWHKQQQSLVTLAVTTRKTSRCFVFDEADRLIGWRNVQTGEERMPVKAYPDFNKAFSGAALYRYEFFDKVPQTGKFSLVDTFLSLAADTVIKGYDHSGGKWVDVGRPESVAVAEAAFE